MIENDILILAFLFFGASFLLAIVDMRESYVKSVEAQRDGLLRQLKRK